MWNAKWQLKQDYIRVATCANNVLWAALVTQDRLYLIKYNCKPLSPHPFQRKDEILLSFGLQSTIWLPVGRGEREMQGESTSKCSTDTYKEIASNNLQNAEQPKNSFTQVHKRAAVSVDGRAYYLWSQITSDRDQIKVTLSKYHITCIVT